VLPVYDLGVDDDGDIYFTMKRVRGDTLEDVLEGLRSGDEHMTLDYDRHRLVSAFARVCLVVDYAHQHGVLHRDLKPANIMLGDFGEVYLVDWGLVKLLGESEIATHPDDGGPSSGGETVAGAILGTPGYMAPEQARGDTILGPTADVYALGAILFEILTTQRLHSGGFAEAIATTITGIEARPSVRAPERDTPPELDEICARASANDPAMRYRNARELFEAVDAWLRGTRDATLRRDASQEHTKEAAAFDGETLDGRKRAIKEIGRALALDPGNAEALEMLAEFLSSPPRERPAEVSEALVRSEHRQFVKVGRMAATGYGMLFLFIPLLLWHGVRRPLPFVAFFVLAAICTGVSAHAASRDETPTGLVGFLMITSSVMFLCLWPLYGTLLLVAPALLSNAVGFSLLMTGWWRVSTIVLGVLFTVGPLLVEMTGAVAPTLVFAHGVITIAPNALELREIPSLILLALSSTTSLVMACVTAGAVKNQLRAAEERLYLRDWQIRALVPGSE
jgi:serine/threonine-protein kinase